MGACWAKFHHAANICHGCDGLPTAWIGISAIRCFFFSITDSSMVNHHQTSIWENICYMLLLFPSILGKEKIRDGFHSTD